MTTVVTTVHGTFARRAGWAQPDSALSHYLTAHLDSPVRIVPFDWSGHNSFEARDRAAKRLREHFDAISRSDPDSHQFVVAHSHGGNVALLAAAELPKRVEGIVCLSTPFLQAWPRNLGAARIVSAAAGIVLLVANLLYLFLRDRVHSSSLWIVITVAAAPLIYIFQKAVGRWADDNRPRWVLPEVDPVRVLILRAAGDEASAALGAAMLLASFVAKFWALTSLGAPLWMRALEQDKAERARTIRYSRPRRIHALSVMAVFVLGIVLCVLSLLPIQPPLVTINFATGVVVASLALNLLVHWRKALAVAVLAPLWWVSMILAGPVLLVLSVFAMAFGSSLALRQALWIVSAEPTPPGVWMTVQLDPDSTPRGFRGLMHSSLYNDPRAHSVIAHWMKQRMTESLRKADPPSIPGHRWGAGRRRLTRAELLERRSGRPKASDPQPQADHLGEVTSSASWAASAPSRPTPLGCIGWTAAGKDSTSGSQAPPPAPAQTLAVSALLEFNGC